MITTRTPMLQFRVAALDCRLRFHNAVTDLDPVMARLDDWAGKFFDNIKMRDPVTLLLALLDYCIPSSPAAKAADDAAYFAQRDAWRRQAELRLQAPRTGGQRPRHGA